MAMDGNALGEAMYNAMMSIEMRQDMSEEEARNAAKNRFRKIGNEIVDHIKGNATIAPLSTTSVPAGVGPHIHNPITTIATGNIS